MEAAPDFSGVHLTDQLVRSLASFSTLYDQRRDRLRGISESAARAVASPNKTVRGVSGGAVGAVCGGAMGALCATGVVAYARLCGETGAVVAVAGLIGGTLGGAAGGMFSGGIGGAVGAAAAPSRDSFRGAVDDAVWFSVGCATGGAFGSIFGKSIGAAGGAAGGGVGAFCGSRFAVYLIGSLADHFSGTNESKLERLKAIGDFVETVRPLLEPLETIQTLAEKMAGDADARRVARQTAATLEVARAFERDAQRRADLARVVSGVDEAARRIGRVARELKETRAGVEQLSSALRKR